MAKLIALFQRIFYWRQVRKIGQQNPDLLHDFTRNILIGLQEAKNGKTFPYDIGGKNSGN